jgi:23S rRNA (cytosine1962-C5)-methyltransferase
MGGRGRETPRRMRPPILVQPEFDDHELVDSGAGEKLERFGPVLVRRPDPQALWRRRADDGEWRAADLAFERDEASGGKRGRWTGREPAREWRIRWRGVTCVLRPTPFKHLGVFPEQAATWAWIEALAPRLGRERPRLLDLFGYTGIASIVAARAGFDVTHVDASKTLLAWMRENARASGLADDSLRIVLDDALAYARREARRGARYAGIVLDPPHHGRGPKGELWQFEEHMAPLIEACGALVDERAFVVLSSYAIGFTPLSLVNLLAELGAGEISSGELALAERRRPGQAERFLPCGFCARWWRGVDAPADDAPRAAP